MAAAVASVLAGALALAAPAAAGVALAVTPNFPRTGVVGQTRLPASIQIQNSSTAPDNDAALTVGTIALTPSCGQAGPGDCPAGAVDPGVIRVNPTASGELGTACAGTAFTVTDPGPDGKVRFIPATPVVLGSPGTAADTCRIDFTIDVLQGPSQDAAGAMAGMQTVQTAVAYASQGGSGLTGAGAGQSLMTIDWVAASLSTHADPNPVAVPGQALVDSALLTGVSNVTGPTGTITFTAFHDPPGAPPCSGPAQALDPVPLVAGAASEPPAATATSPPVTASGPGTYRFVASYSGDPRYVPIPTTACGEAGESVEVVGSGSYTGLTPARILDTRTGIGGVTAPVAAGATLRVPVAGQGGVPAMGVAAVAVNVTVTEPTAGGYLTVYPAGEPRPVASNLNFTAGRTVPVLAVVKVGAAGSVDVFNSAGSTQVVVDVAGWFSDAATGVEGRYQPLVPARILDTRTGTGGTATRLGAGATLDVQVASAGGVPGSGAEAVAVNVAVTNTASTGYLTVYPTGGPRPLASNLNWAAGDTVSNRALVKLGSGGRVTIYNSAGDTDVIVDANGWFADPSGPAGSAYAPLTPARILDTRLGVGGVAGPVGAWSTVDVAVTGQGGVPAAGVSAAVLSVTVASPAGPGYLTIFPAGTPRPLASDLNFAAGENRANLVVVKVGSDGKLSVFTPATTDVIVDVAGWFG